jgi:ribonuclease HII
MILCGIDEAGRGPLAGPVVAAAVVLYPDFPIGILGDSKTLSEKRREKAAGVIRELAADYSISLATHEEIDAINILRASLLAMKRACEGLKLRPEKVVVDGPYCPEIDCPCEGIIRGDGLVPEIMAASILAKTYRDDLMRAYAKKYPLYGFEKHKGYPTRAHQEALKKYGPSEVHRRSFRLSFFS